MNKHKKHCTCRQCSGTAGWSQYNQQAWFRGWYPRTLVEKWAYQDRTEK